MERRPESLHELCAALWQFESDLGLLRRTAAGVHFWPLIRVEVFQRLTEALGIYRAGHPAWTGRVWRRHLGDGLNLIRDLRFSPWRVSGPRPEVVIPHPRKQWRDGAAIDVCSQRIIEECAGRGVLVLDPPGPDGRYLTAAGGPVRRTGILRALAKMRALPRAPGLRKALRQDHAAMSAALRARLGAGLPVSLDWLALRLALFHEQRALYRSVFRKAQAERLFIAIAYFQQEAVAAAHDLGIPVHELQHGLIGRYHLGYHFPGRPHVPYAPDRLLTFGRFWTEGIDLPANTSASVIGSENVARYRALRGRPHPRRVVVLSQGTIGERLFAIAIAAAEAAPDWEFVFRLHPSELAAPYRASMARRARVPANFRLCGPEGDFYALLASAEVQMGVCSTGIFEGLMLGVRTILVPLSGIEHMDGLVERGDAVLAGTAEEVAARLDSAPCASDPALYYAAPVPSLEAALLPRARAGRGAGECVSPGSARTRGGRIGRPGGP